VSLQCGDVAPENAGTQGCRANVYLRGLLRSALMLFGSDRALSLCRWLAVFCACAVPLRARADVFEVPIGGKPISLEGRIACTANLEGGFVLEAGGRSVRPPDNASAVGHVAELPVAASASACADNPTLITLIATQRWPSFDASSIVFSPDDGRIEGRGRLLEGVTIEWSASGKTGSDTCHDPQTDGELARCAWAVSVGGGPVGADAAFSWLPGGARAEPGAVFFDASGRRAPPDTFAFEPARIVLRKLVPTGATVDLSTGRGQVPLVHPEAVASAECKALQCEMTSGALVVHGASNLINQLEIKLRLLPHIAFATKDGSEQQPSVKLSVLHCPMSIVSGAPVRNDDDAKVVVELQGGCARDLSSVRFESERGPAVVLQSVVVQDATFVLLGIGSVSADSITLSALRGAEDIALAVAQTPTRNTPRVRASIELPGFPNLDFIPNNRTAAVHVPPPGEHEHYALLPIEGVYAAENGPDGTMTIRGDANAAGLTQLYFGLRNAALPPPFDKADLAQVQDPLQRSIHEANVPAPLGESVFGKHPFVEMLCGAGKDATRIPIGVTDHLSFDLRDTCRVVFHRERLGPEYGTQRINFEIDVIRSDGTTRAEAHVAEVVTLRAGPQPRYAWIHGVVDPFDRVIVRLSHEADEAHYLGASEVKTGAPAVQWSAVLGTGRVRLYGTTAIPTGLYRFSDSAHSGVLSLNFGVISRLTWLDSEGHEGFIGAEGGVMAIGLANSRSESGESLTQVGAVLGLGISVPIANRSLATQASINLHGWFEANITQSNSKDSMGNSVKDSKGRYAFIFGPSITIGNVGVNL
jgi:hypothetical protein